MLNRKRWITLGLTVICFLSIYLHPQFALANEVRLFYNGTKIEDPNLEMIDQRVFVTVDVFVNHYGLTYTWDPLTDLLVINDNVITKKYGKPQIKNNQLIASIRAMVETLAEGSMSIQWKGTQSIVIVEQDHIPVIQQSAEPIQAEQKSVGWRYSMIAVTFVGTILFYWLIVYVMTQLKSNHEKRLRKYISTPQFVSQEERETPVKSAEKRKNRLIVIIGQLFKSNAVRNKWELDLEQAGVRIKPEEFMAIRLLLAFIVGSIFFIVGAHWLMIVLLSLLLFWIPVFYIRRKKAVRLAKCSTQLTNALGVMANSLRAGFSFMQALQFVGKEISDPLGPEINRTLREINFGVEIEEAFRKLVMRLPDRDLELVVHSLMIQRQTGGNLAELLETLQETIRERIRLKDELKALTAQGRLSAWVISLLPVFLGLILNLMSPDYFGPMINHPLGWFMLGIGSLMGLLGWFFIQKIVKIEV